MEQSDLQTSKFKLKKESNKVIRVTEELLLNELKRRYNTKGRDTLFKSTTIAKELKGSVYVIRDLLPKLEEKKLVEKTELSRGPIVWRTKLGGKK